MEPFPRYPSFLEEIERAEAARQAGNEGMARVCARRAAGIVAQAYLNRQSIDFRTSSAYDRLKFLRDHASLDPQVRVVIDHFLIRITPEKKLPIDADLIAEAHWLATKLLP